ncbi:hypothetical protein GH722_14520 [Alphaproteobacteria bacterium HT1-32]|nr:hypothetical protein [Alphaproteobacteria bacterium HT1-32]
MATEKTVTSAAPVVKTETAKPSVAPVKTAPVQEQAPKAESVDVKAPKAAEAAPVEQKSVDTTASEKTASVKSVPAKPARAKTKTRATAKSKPANTAKPKVAKKAKAPRSVKPAEAKPAKPAKPAASLSVQAKQVRGMVSPFGTAEAIGAEVTNATVQLNETISDFVSGGIDRSVRHLEAVRNVKGLDELCSMNTKFFEAEFESWMTASLKAFGTGSDLVDRVSAPMEEQVMSVARTVKDRFAA